MEHPSERRLDLLLRHLPAIPHQHRQYRGISGHHVHGHERLDLLVHHIHRLRDDQTHSRPSVASSTMESGSRRSRHQHNRVALPDVDLGILLLPNLRGVYSVRFQLECCHQWRRYGICHQLLLLIREEAVLWACGVGQVRDGAINLARGV